MLAYRERTFRSRSREVVFKIPLPTYPLDFESLAPFAVPLPLRFGCPRVLLRLNGCMFTEVFPRPGEDERRSRKWKAEREDGRLCFRPVCLYIYIYIHACLSKLRHTPPAIEREITAGGIMGIFPSCPWHSRLSVPGQRCYFLDFVGGWGGGRAKISDCRPAEGRRQYRPTSQIPGVGYTHKA